MAGPVTGPYVKEVFSPSDGRNVAYYKYSSGYKQKRPFTDPLYYKSKSANCSINIQNIASSSYDAFSGGSTEWLTNGFFGSFADVGNRSYDKLKDRAYETASWGPNIAEYKQSANMLNSRLVQLGLFVGALRRGKFGEASKHLNVLKPPKGVSRKKQFANNFLEYHFGWSPLIQDIYSTIDVFQQPIASTFVRSVCRESFPTTQLVVPVQFDGPLIASGGVYRRDFYRKVTATKFSRRSVRVAVSNPNLHLADQLGLINPLTVAWELVPFSFVADWFVNAGQVIGSMTDFCGLTLQGAYTTTGVRGHISQRDVQNYSWFNPGTSQWVLTDFVDNTEQDFLHFERLQGLSGPTLTVRPLKLPSLTRAATAVSLIVQAMR